MITSIWIGLWGWLFCGPLSEAGQIFGGVKGWLYYQTATTRKIPAFLFNPLIGCAKCHAGQIALWWQVYSWAIGAGFHLPYILTAIFAAIIFTDFEQIREKWKN